MVELSLLKLCLKHNSWLEAKKVGLSTSLLASKELQTLFSVLDNFHATNNNHIDLSVPDLSNLVFASVSKDHEFYSEVLANLETLDVSEATTKTLLHSVVRKAKLQQLSMAAYEAYEGKDTDGRFDKLLESFSRLPETLEEEEGEFVTDDLEELLDGAVNSPGLEWRLHTLNQMLGPLRKGNAGFIFARPETGKTTFFGSEISHMAQQSEDTVLWFANEDEGELVKLRIIQGTLGVTLAELNSNPAYWKAEFNRLMRGRIKLKAAGTITASEIERKCAKYKPSLIVIDQLAHIAGFKDDKKNLELGKQFRWARELGKEYAPIIAAHQAGGTGEGVAWLDMSHVDEVKTAAQANTDWILGIGKKNQDGFDAIRFLHLSKNKLAGGKHTIPSLRHGKKEVLIEPDICRYTDL